jgi:hypothetical protein
MQRAIYNHYNKNIFHYILFIKLQQKFVENEYIFILIHTLKQTKPEIGKYQTKNCQPF